MGSSKSAILFLSYTLLVYNFPFDFIALKILSCHISIKDKTYDIPNITGIIEIPLFFHRLFELTLKCKHQQYDMQ